MTDQIREKMLRNMYGDLAQSLGTPEFKERIAKAEAKKKAEELRIAAADLKRARRAKRGSK